MKMLRVITSVLVVCFALEAVSEEALEGLGRRLRVDESAKASSTKSSSKKSVDESADEARLESLRLEAMAEGAGSGDGGTEGGATDSSTEDSESSLALGDSGFSKGGRGRGEALASSSRDHAAASGLSEKGTSESETPLRAASKAETNDKPDGSATRLVLTLFILASLLGATYFGLKRWARTKQGGGEKVKIKILAQHFLGPKKSIAIVRIAGDSFVVGVTDHNINLIKTLSLLDEEIPERVPQNFNSSLDEFEERSLAEVAGDEEGRRQGNAWI